VHRDVVSPTVAEGRSVTDPPPEPLASTFKAPDELQESVACWFADRLGVWFMQPAPVDWVPAVPPVADPWLSASADPAMRKNAKMLVMIVLTMLRPYETRSFVPLV
jgi:hypothetical protein